MKILRRLSEALLVAFCLVAISWGLRGIAHADPAPLAQPCAASACQVTGAAVRVTIPLRAAPGRFAGKFELVPLFDRGKPVIRNGHQYLALRNMIDFRRPNGELLAIPAGMTTDLASVPQVFWPILPPDGPYGEASTPHDLCYKSKGTFTWFNRRGRDRAQPYTRAECDEILREGMVALGVPAWKRIVVYEGVRVGGANGWGS